MSMETRHICEVLAAGMQTTVQDVGRIGYASVGVPRAGAMDQFALAAANLSVGNPPTAAALEILLHGLHLHFHESCQFAIAGADLQATLNGIAVLNWMAHTATAGAELRFTMQQSGARAYLAVAGGFAVSSLLHSASTYLPGGWGGLDGRALHTGDVLEAHAMSQSDGIELRPEHRPPYSTFPTVRCVFGPHSYAFDEAARSAFLDATYRLSPACDRMGLRMEGTAIEATERALPSAGVIAGCIQIPPDGQPIVLMADAQTTGGYPIIATVISADLPLLAQLLPGDRVRFQPITSARANDLARVQQHNLLSDADPFIIAPI